MKFLMIAIAALFFLPPTPVHAGSWTGYLVDSKCYDAEERSVNPFSTTTDVDRDKDQEIRVCSPSAKTNSFALVELDGLISHKLDLVGNGKAIVFVRKTGKKLFNEVTVTGETDRNAVKVESISESK